MSMTVATRAAPLFLIFSLTICDAHDPAQHKQWYKNLRSRANAVCCTGQDAEVITDANWVSSNGNYRVILDGQWFDVHPSAVVPGPNFDGRTLVWPQRTQWGILGIRCFMPGVMG